ncbi:hypothetical protein COSHB9_02610 [Companilactobacillus alimentarius]
MVNVIDNGARNRTNMMPVGIKVIDDKGNVAYTAKTDLGTNYISLESKWFGSSSNKTGGSTGGNTGDGDSGGTNPTAAGANYYAGSLANGEITQRNFEWGGTDDPTKSNTITFKDAQGSKFNGNYDGIQLLGHIQKTVVTNGVAGTVTDLPLNCDVNNVVKSGCYTTLASYPIYINNSSINVGSAAFVPIIGIGENLGGKNVKAPSISLTLNANMTLTLTHDKGYSNDGASPATGVEYQFIVDTISTYSVQNAVSQLPSTVNLFTGSSVGNVLLTGPSTYHENAEDGYLITLSNQTLAAPNSSFGGVYSIPLGDDQVRMDLSSIGLKGIKVPKEELIMNNSFDVSDQLSQYVGKVVQGQYNSSGSWININPNYSFSIVSFEGSSIKILPNENINLSLTVHVTEKSSNNVDNAKFSIPVIRVNTYKN